MFASAAKPLNIGARAPQVVPQAQAAALLNGTNLLNGYLLGSPSFLESLKGGSLKGQSDSRWPRGLEYPDAILDECSSVPRERTLPGNVATSLGRLMMAIPAGLAPIHHLFPFGAGWGAALLAGSTALSLQASTDPEEKNNTWALSAYFGVAGGGALALLSYLLHSGTPYSPSATFIMGGLLSGLGVFQRWVLGNGNLGKEDRLDDFAALGTGIVSALASRHVFVTTGNFPWALLTSATILGIGAIVAGGVKSFWERWSPRTRALFAATRRIDDALRDEAAIVRYFSLRPERLKRFLKYLPEELRILRVAEEERIKRVPISDEDPGDLAEQERILKAVTAPFDRLSERIPGWRERLAQDSSEEAVEALVPEIRAASDLRIGLN